MTDLSELQINVLQRALYLEESARRLLNKPEGEALTEAEADLRDCADAFALARSAAAQHVERQAQEAAKPEPEAPPHPAFEITP